MMQSNDTLWKPLGSPAGNPADGWLLFCPFAGGSASAFGPWREPGACPWPAFLATYPGRDQRRKEPFQTSIPPIARDMAGGLLALPRPAVDRLILVGHSMGAQVAFEICRLLETAGRSPAALVLSGCQAPHLRGRRLLAGLDDRAFVETLIRIGGCSPELRDHPGLLEVFLPLLRADFEATESYLLPNDGRQERVRTPTLLIQGSRDEEANADEVLAWEDWLAGETACTEIAGDHFYPTRRPRAFCEAIAGFCRGRLLLCA